MQLPKEQLHNKLRGTLEEYAASTDKAELIESVKVGSWLCLWLAGWLAACS